MVVAVGRAVIWDVDQVTRRLFAWISFVIWGSAWIVSPSPVSRSSSSSSNHTLTPHLLWLGLVAGHEAHRPLVPFHYESRSKHWPISYTGSVKISRIAVYVVFEGLLLRAKWPVSVISRPTWTNALPIGELVIFGLPCWSIGRLHSDWACTHDKFFVGRVALMPNLTTLVVGWPKESRIGRPFPPFSRRFLQLLRPYWICTSRTTAASRHRGMLHATRGQSPSMDSSILLLVDNPRIGWKSTSGMGQ